MAYFPLFINMEKCPCLVVGGGKVAARKVQTLVEYGAEVTVVAKEVLPRLRTCSQIEIRDRNFEAEDLKGKKLVFVATDDEDCNRYIAGLCREAKIPVNVADEAQLCDFYFPALVRREDVVVGISTGGSSPLAARRIRETLERILPDSLGAAVRDAKKMRRALLEQGKTPDDDTRYKGMVDKYFKTNFSGEEGE